ncbi:MAG: TIGR01777 family oxidoreductase [Myxococcales bacterium]|nr:TIGR01777 family oxidoreductase [Myxococcales bacterium]
MARFVRRTALPHTPEALYAWHLRPGAFERLTPPWERVRVRDRPPAGIAEGADVRLETRVGPLWLPWVAHHTGFVPGRKFEDTQLAGPFSAWHHAHRFEPAERGAVLVDDIEYELPLGPVGRLLGAAFVTRKLERMFEHRHRITALDLDAHAQTRQQGPMNILVGGASGLVGTALCAFLSTGGHTVRRLVRASGPKGPDAVPWDPRSGELDPAALEGVDAVVHLSGEPIASGRWTEAKKRKILDSRVISTRMLAEAMARRSTRPKVFVCASAVGFYGDQGDNVLTEGNRRGDGFLAEVCEAWEDATRPASDAGVRVVNARLGVVLSPKGGALAKMLPAFKLGAGGPLGHGEQYLSWISLEDVVGALHHALVTPSLEGPVNLTAPTPVTSRSLAQALGGVLGRPAALPAPVFALRAAFGREMADQTVLASQRAVPKKLLATGYAFRHPELIPALHALLGR